MGKGLEKDKSKDKEKAKNKEQDKEKARELEREKEKKKAQAEKEKKERAKLGYSKNELSRISVDDDEKERIREVARKLKEESEQKMDSTIVQKPVVVPMPPRTITAGMGRIPKLVKKHPDPPDKDNKKLKESLSFGDLLGSMDTKPRSITKNKS